MKGSEDIWKYAVEEAISTEEAFHRDTPDTSKEFAENGEEIYATA